MHATDIMGSGLAWLWRATWQASVLVLLVVLVQWLFRARLTPQWRHALWWLVLIRLLLPVAPATPFSLFNFAPVEPAVETGARLQSVWNGGSWRRGPAFAIENPTQRLAPTSPSAGSAAEATRADSPPAPAAVPGVAIRASTASSPAHRAFWALFGFWLTGVLFLGVRLIIGNYGFAGRLGRRSPSRHPVVLATLEECRRVLGVRRPPVVVETPEVDSPALFGCFWVKLLLPPRMAATFSEAELRHVFLHELAHVRRGDVPANWLMTLVQIVHRFNPVVWFAFARMRADRELACDALALSLVSEKESQSYGNTIIKLLEGFLRPATVPGLVGILEDKDHMKRRISMIATFKQRSRWSLPAIALFVGLGLVALTDAQTEKGSTNAPTTAASSDDVIDPTNGLRYVVAKTVTGTNDVIDYDGQVVQSPNGKFLLWWDRIVSLDGSPTFEVKELKGAGIAEWSPDGRQIAFNKGGIEVLPVSPETGRATGPARKLLEQNDNWFRGKLYWSADSEQILYVKYNGRMEREVGSINLRDGQLNKQPNYADFGLVSPDGKTSAYSIPLDGIWAKPTDGGPGRILRPPTGGWLSDGVTLWSADSQWVISAVKGWWREEIHFARVSDGQGFDVFPPAVAGAFVGKSSDGRKLCFYHSSFDSRSTFKVMPVSGEPVLDVGLTDDSGDPWDHAWTADSAWLAVVAWGGKARQQLSSTRVAGGERVEFNLDTIGTNRLWVWSISPGCERVLCDQVSGTNQNTKKEDLYIAPISLKEGRATGPAQLVFDGWRNPNPTVTEQMGAWSPDGTQVAMPHQADQDHEIWILSADGGDPKRIIQTPDKVGSRPQWSPDGKMIAFHLTAADREMLQVISAEGGLARTILTTPQGQVVPFAWSPGSQEIVAVLDGTLTGFLISGGSGRVVANLREKGYDTPSWLRWFPDGKHLAFHSGSRLHLLSPATGEIADLNTPLSSAWSFTWSPDSKMISCISEESKKVRPAGVIRELDVAEALQKAPPLAARKPTPSTNAPPPEPIAGPVFTDNFDNGSSKHWRFQDLPDAGWGPGKHAVEKGQLMLTHARAYLDGIDWTDYIVAVRVCGKESAANGLRGITLVTRATPSPFGSSNLDRYVFGIFRNDDDPPYLWLGLNYSDGSDTLRHGPVSRAPFNLVLGQWYTLEFEVRGQQLRGFVDGQLMVEGTDARLTKGSLWINAGKNHALFDDFSVRQLPLDR